MSGYAFDANVIIDALGDHPPAVDEVRRASAGGAIAWVSRIIWVEVLSKRSGEELRRAELFLSAFGVDELDEEIARHAAALRRERPRLRTPDAIILASARLRGRTLVTRNIKDFPVETPGVRIPYTI